MKVVGFKALGKKEKKKKAKIYCVSNVFRNTMFVFSFLLVFFTFCLIDTSFTSTFKECINNFIKNLFVF